MEKENQFIRCTMCEWEGIEENLVRGEDEEGCFDGCPKCKTDDYLMNIDHSELLKKK